MLTQKLNKLQIMIRVKIKDMEAWEELQKNYGVRLYSSVLKTLRKVTPKLLSEDDLLEFVIPLSFFSVCYRTNIQAFVTHLRKKSPLTIFSKAHQASGFAIIRIGWDKTTPCFGFAKNLTKQLKDPNTFSVDALIDNIPDSYRQNIHHFLHRLTHRLGRPVKRLVLGDTIRFYKPKQKQQIK